MNGTVLVTKSFNYYFIWVYDNNKVLVGSFTDLTEIEMRNWLVVFENHAEIKFQSI
jgi:hypothetical protein